MKRLLIAAAALALLALPACTVTGSDGTPVTLTAANAPALVLAGMKSACPTLVSAQAKATSDAVTAALNVSAQTKGTVDTVENVVSIGCTLLTPPPAQAPPAAPIAPVAILTPSNPSAG